MLISYAYIRLLIKYTYLVRLGILVFIMNKMVPNFACIC